MKVVSVKPVGSCGQLITAVELYPATSANAKRAISCACVFAYEKVCVLCVRVLCVRVLCVVCVCVRVLCVVCCVCVCVVCVRVLCVCVMHGREQIHSVKRHA